MKKKRLIDFFKTTQKQRENQKMLFSEIPIIVGSFWLASGVGDYFRFDAKFRIAMGLIVLIFGLIARKELITKRK